MCCLKDGSMGNSAAECWREPVADIVQRGLQVASN